MQIHIKRYLHMFISIQQSALKTCLEILNDILIRIVTIRFRYRYSRYRYR